jgi:hypothetical protein
MSKSYLIEKRELGGWADAGWTDDDEPRRFTSAKKGRQAIEDFITDQRVAVSQGLMDRIDDANDLRVVPAPVVPHQEEFKVTFTLNRKPTRKERDALIEEFFDGVEERFELCGARGHTTVMEEHRVGHILVETPTGLMEICGS